MAETPLKILIVDNHPLFLESITSVLASPDYEIRKAQGGLEAIDIMDEFKPNIFFIDLIMPFISGEKLTRYIRSQKEFAGAFIVILSGIAKESDRVDIPRQADAFIAKGPLKTMASHILDVIDIYRNKKRNTHPEEYLGANEIAPRHITRELLFSVKHLEILLENMEEGVVEVSVDNRIVYMNPASLLILETGEFSLLSKNLSEAFKGMGADHITGIMELFDRGEEVRDVVIPIGRRFVQTSILKVLDGDLEAKIILLNDVTSYKEKEAGLNKALGEKEMLIREIHHRVKNNLNVISGLLSIQSMMIENEAVRDAVLEIQPRLQSISLVHDKLYNSEDLRNIDLKQYLGELAELLLSMMSDNGLSVGLKIDIPELVLETNMTVSLGLICTELITNAVKYGFYRDNPEQNILSLELIEERGELKLSVINNGRPFPEDVDVKQSKRLGFQVINLLIDQIGGRLELDRSESTRFTIIFPKL